MGKPLVGFVLFLVAVLSIICFGAFIVAPGYIGDRALSPLAIGSWVLGAGSVLGFLLIGQRIWWAWYINVCVQFLWIVFWIWQRELGPIITCVIYILVFVQNSVRWSREYIHDERDIPANSRSLKRLFPKREQEESVE